MVTIQKTFTKLLFFETLKSISDTLQDLTFVQLNVDKIVGGGGGGGGPDINLGIRIKCGSEMASYKKG